MEILAVQNLNFYYPESAQPALSDLSISVEEGEFFVVCGRSGCGKSTLLRHLKPQLAPHGIKSGHIYYDGVMQEQLEERVSAAQIGFVLQSPDNQIVTDKVWHELAFGMESLGYDTPEIRRRVAEMASFFGIQNWFYKEVSELSGGQKQLLNLASVMVLQPRVLILDEPTSQLDPIAASDFLAVLKKINRELGTTIILTEHRLEEAFSMASHAAVLEEGRLLCCASVRELGEYLRQNAHTMFLAMPAAMRIWGSVASSLDCPVSVKEGREFLCKYIEGEAKDNLHRNVENGALYACIEDEERLLENTGYCRDDEPKVRVSNVWFRYEKDSADVVCDVNLTAFAGEWLCILGGNGTGKTTTLKLFAHIYQPYRGEVQTEGRIGYLPQNPQTLFVKKTVWEDLSESLQGQKISKEEREERIGQILSLCRLSRLKERHPYDLSGGEQQRAALAKLLLRNPDILLLDEPTKGMDAEFKTEFAGILQVLQKAGVCLVMVSHDIEFCAQYANRCALFFAGSLVSEGTPREFFTNNSFYTTSASRIARNIISNVVTTEDVIQAIDGHLPKTSLPLQAVYVRKQENKTTNVEPKRKLPLWRKIGASITAFLAFVLFLYAAKTGDLRDMIDQNGITIPGKNQLEIYFLFLGSLVLTAVLIGRRSAPPVVPNQVPKEKRKLSRRTWAAVGLVLLLVPLTLFVGVVYVGQKQYYLTALAVLIECMLPFFLVFEGRHMRARELVVIAVVCALNVAGRAAFFMLPQFKPVLALTILAGVAFGGETGFLVGAVTMLVSNILFSQGPWTPWQMFAMGIIGFLAGILYRKGWLSRTRISLCIFGAICAVLIYGGIMNPCAALIWGSEALNVKLLLGYYVTGFPMDCVHAAATVVFLWVLAEPMLEKLDRIKVKYGLVE